MIRLHDFQDEARRLGLAELNRAEAALIVMPTGCHDPDQGILMFDGAVKEAKDIQPGDKLMGPDSTPRTVLLKHEGVKPMCRVIPVKGKPFVVTEDHTLTLIRTNETANPRFPCDSRGGEVVDITVREWMSWPKWRKHIHKIFRVPVEFPDAQPARGLDPYFVGVLLGNGSLDHSPVSVTDGKPEIERECEVQASRYGVTLRKDIYNNCGHFFFSKHERSRYAENGMTTATSTSGLLGMQCGTKRVPFLYRTASLEDRLDVLAGLMDTDGHLSENSGTGYDFISKSQKLSEDTAFLARSVGLAAYVSECRKGCQTGAVGTYWRVSISGDTSIIPCRVAYKKASPRQQKKDVLRTGFSVEEAGEGPYVGFTVDGDHRYLMDDFTVTHNCGKSITGASIAAEMVRRGGRVLILVHRKEFIRQWADACDVFGLNWGVEQAERRAHRDTLHGRVDVVIGSKDTMQGQRLAKWNKDTFTLIIGDEAHHSSARSWLNVFAHFASARRLGLTATPVRSDEESIQPVFGNCAYELLFWEAVDRQYIAAPLFFRPPAAIDLSMLRSSGEDLNQGDLEDAINAHIEELVNLALPLLDGRPILTFTPRVASATAMAAGFRTHPKGFPSSSVSGKSDDRDLVIQQFRQGVHRNLCSCDLLREGTDFPDVGNLVIARPTESELVYRQMMGRGLRKKPENYAIIVDYAVKNGKHDLFEPMDLFDATGMDLDVLALAARLVNEGKHQDPREALKEADRVHRQEVELRVQVQERTPSYKMIAYDPFQIGSLLGVPNRQRETQKPCSAKNRARLEAKKLNPKGISNVQAETILKELERRQTEQLCTHRQLALLVSKGVPSEFARQMTAQAAHDDLDIIIGERRRA